MKRGPKPSGNKAMTAAERQARFRATHANRAPRIRYRSPVDRRSRAQRWHAAVAELITLRDDYRTWRLRCRRTLRQARRRKRCARPVILIYPISRAWSHRAVLVATDAKSACRLRGLLRAERADARSVKTTSAASSVHAPGVGRALRYAEGFAPARRPAPTDSDISKWQKQRHLYLVDTTGVRDHLPRLHISSAADRFGLNRR